MPLALGTESHPVWTRYDEVTWVKASFDTGTWIDDNIIWTINKLKKHGIVFLGEDQTNRYEAYDNNNKTH